ncbi:hypothetical protein DFJ73DRAFT_165540 [Zopfochytrium polystomum]|nr:hypothetical protein DFJ73DRAFT_165540 [Zopfochytrium polystomum]
MKGFLDVLQSFLLLYSFFSTLSCPCLRNGEEEGGFDATFPWTIFPCPCLLQFTRWVTLGQRFIAPLPQNHKLTRSSLLPSPAPVAAPAHAQRATSNAFQPDGGGGRSEEYGESGRCRNCAKVELMPFHTVSAKP